MRIYFLIAMMFLVSACSVPADMLSFSVSAVQGKQINGIIPVDCPKYYVLYEREGCEGNKIEKIEVEHFQYVPVYPYNVVNNQQQPPIYMDYN